MRGGIRTQLHARRTGKRRWSAKRRRSPLQLFFGALPAGSLAAPFNGSEIAGGFGAGDAAGVAFAAPRLGEGNGETFALEELS